MDEKPINCPRCGKFMKTKAFVSESGMEKVECTCKCGLKFITEY